MKRNNKTRAEINEIGNKKQKSKTKNQGIEELFL